MHDRNVEPVEYQRAESPYATRKSVRLLLILTLLNTIMLGSSLLGPKTWTYVGSVYQQWKAHRAAKAAAQAQLQKDIAAQKSAINFSLPDNTVVYEENWDKALKLLQNASGYQPALPADSMRPANYQVPAAQINPQVYKDLTFRLNGGTRYPAAMAFLHERMSPSHRPMLVAAELTSLFNFGVSAAQSSVYKGRRLWVSAWNLSPNGIEIPTAFTSSMEFTLPDTRTHPISDEQEQMSAGGGLRLFAGMVDPKDDSKFIIPFEVDGKKGQIVAKLTENGFVLTPSMGKAISSNGDVTQWELLPSTAAPSPTPR